MLVIMAGVFTTANAQYIGVRIGPVHAGVDFGPSYYAPRVYTPVYYNYYRPVVVRYRPVYSPVYPYYAPQTVRVVERTVKPVPSTSYVPIKAQKKAEAKAAARRYAEKQQNGGNTAAPSATPQQQSAAPAQPAKAPVSAYVLGAM